MGAAASRITGFVFLKNIINKDMEVIEISDTVIRPRIIGYKITKDERDDVLHEMADYLISLGLVRDTYGDSVIERENKYPTGIDTEPIPVAIPHSEREEVIKTAILVGQTKESGVSFQKIEGDGVWINSKVIFMLAVDTDQGQLEVISRLMGVIQDSSVVKCVVDAENTNEIEKIVSNAFDRQD